MAKLREMAQLGVKARTQQTRTGARNQALAMANSADQSQFPLLKKRKLNDDDGKLRVAPSYTELRSCRVTVNGHNLALVEEKLCPNPSSDTDNFASVSCCLSNGSSEKANERAGFVDLEVNENVEVETFSCCSCRDEEESETPTRELSVLKKTMATAAEDQNSGRRKSAVVVVEKMNMPLKLEIEEFFAEAEKNIQKEFAEKYNFDIVKDQPLQGRCQWVRMRP